MLSMSRTLPAWHNFRRPRWWLPGGLLSWGALLCTRQIHHRSYGIRRRRGLWPCVRRSDQPLGKKLQSHPWKKQRKKKGDISEMLALPWFNQPLRTSMRRDSASSGFRMCRSWHSSMPPLLAPSGQSRRQRAWHDGTWPCPQPCQARDS